MVCQRGGRRCCGGGVGFWPHCWLAWGPQVGPKTATSLESGFWWPETTRCKMPVQMHLHSVTWAFRVSPAATGSLQGGQQKPRTLSGCSAAHVLIFPSHQSVHTNTENADYTSVRTKPHPRKYNLVTQKPRVGADTVADPKVPLQTPSLSSRCSDDPELSTPSLFLPS